MHIGISLLSLLSLAVLSLAAQPHAAAQSDGSLKGRISLKATGDPLHGASVTIVELGRITLSQDDGSYRFQQVPPGRYTVEAHLDSLFTEASTTVTIEASQTAEADFLLVLAPPRYEITVTGSGKRETTFESFQSVESIGPHELSQSTEISLGEMLDHRVGTGIAKRSFGPGTARPIVRGFDGDRVLIMEDGIRTGTLSSQSGDHGEMINPAQLERLEIVKGPATLLYSGNAMGGTVNAISRHHEVHRHAHQGFRGFLSGSGGTANALGGGSAGLEYGTGNWMIWGRGGGVRTGDYRAPEQGQIYNSRSQLRNGGAGLGWYGDKIFFSVEAKFDDGAYGVPFVQEFHGHHGDEEDEHRDEEDEDHDHDEEDGDHDEEEDHDEDGDHHDEEGEEHGHEEEGIDRILLDSRRRNFRFTGGLRDLGTAIDEFVLKLSLTDWNHKEIEFFENGEQHVGTTFDQQEFVYRGVFEQKKVGPLSGRFGFWGLDREYSAVGEEALSPPIDQTGFALYALEELDFETARFQFGGRLETQRYRPGFADRGGDHADEEDGNEEHEHEAEEGEEIPEAVNRTFTGASASAGLQVDTWSGGSLVVNYSHSFRSPSLEELYNYGPHAGTLSFEIGDLALRPETGDGIEMSLRHNSQGVRGELNLFLLQLQQLHLSLCSRRSRRRTAGDRIYPAQCPLPGNRGQPRHQPESQALAQPRHGLRGRPGDRPQHTAAENSSASRQAGVRFQPPGLPRLSRVDCSRTAAPDLYRRDPHARIRRDEPEGLLHPRPAAPGPSVLGQGLQPERPALPQPFLIHQGLGSRDRPRPAGDLYHAILLRISAGAGGK